MSEEERVRGWSPGVSFADGAMQYGQDDPAILMGKLDEIRTSCERDVPYARMSIQANLTSTQGYLRGQPVM